MTKVAESAGGLHRGGPLSTRYPKSFSQSAGFSSNYRLLSWLNPRSSTTRSTRLRTTSSRYRPSSSSPSRPGVRARRHQDRQSLGQRVDQPADPDQRHFSKNKVVPLGQHHLRLSASGRRCLEPGREGPLHAEGALDSHAAAPKIPSPSAEPDLARYLQLDPALVAARRLHHPDRTHGVLALAVLCRTTTCSASSATR